MFIINNIPFAMLDNIVLLGILWIFFNVIEKYSSIKASKLFSIAVLIQFTALVLFLTSIFSGIYFNKSLSFLQVDSLSFSNNKIAYFGLGYCLVLLVLIIRFIIQFNGLRVLKSKANYSNSDAIYELLYDLTIPIPTNLKIGYSANINGPVVFGYLEPVILLPLSLCTNLSTNEVKLILMHELVHILRKDYITNIFIEFSQIILCFNPFAHLLNKSIQLQREIACDDLVLAATNAPLEYTKALYNVAKLGQSNQPLMLAAIKSKGELVSRICKINGIESAFTKGPLVYLAIACLFLVSLFKFDLNNDKVYPTKLTNIHYSNTLPLFKKEIKKSGNISQINASQNNRNNHKSITKRKMLAKDASYDITGDINTDKDLTYNDLLLQTKQWIKDHEQSSSLNNYNNFSYNVNLNENYISKDSTYTLIADKLLISSIVKGYQLKKSLLEKRIRNAVDMNEANDYLYNSKEWEEMLQYEKWTSEFLKRNQ